MKSPVALFVVSVLTLVFVLFQLFSVRPRALPESDVALLYYAIGHHCRDCSAFSTYAVDTVFRTFGPTKLQADEARKERVYGALTRKPRAAFIAHADLATLLRPNTSPAVRKLRRQQVQAYGKIPPFALTFSAPAVLPDGTTCYYVERLQQDRRWGSGDIYVVRNGAIISEFSVWINYPSLFGTAPRKCLKPFGTRSMAIC